MLQRSAWRSHNKQHGQNGTQSLAHPPERNPPEAYLIRWLVLIWGLPGTVWLNSRLEWLERRHKAQLLGIKAELAQHRLYLEIRKDMRSCSTKGCPERQVWIRKSVWYASDPITKSRQRSGGDLARISTGNQAFHTASLPRRTNQPKTNSSKDQSKGEQTTEGLKKEFS